MRRGSGTQNFLISIMIENGRVDFNSHRSSRLYSIAIDRTEGTKSRTFAQGTSAVFQRVLNTTLDHGTWCWYQIRMSFFGPQDQVGDESGPPSRQREDTGSEKRHANLIPTPRPVV